MNRKDEDSERFSDLVYEAWRSGRNPDAVSRDRYDDFRIGGYYPDEIRLDDVYPKHSRIREEDKQEE